MEIERVKFAVKSYLRTRLAKIEKNLLFIVEKDRSNLLSEAEMQFAFGVYEGRTEHYKQAFFEKIPAKLNPFREEEENLEERISKSILMCLNYLFYSNCTKYQRVRFCAHVEGL